MEEIGKKDMSGTAGDLTILRLITLNPYLSTEHLIEDLPARERAVKARIKRLEELGYIRRGWIINKDACWRFMFRVELCFGSFPDAERSEPIQSFISRAYRIVQERYHGQLIIDDIFSHPASSKIYFVIRSFYQAEDVMNEVFKHFTMELCKHPGVINQSTEVSWPSKTVMDRFDRRC